MEERENRRRLKNRKLLHRAKQKDKLMEEMVKDFVTKLESEKVSFKTSCSLEIFLSDSNYITKFLSLSPRIESTFLINVIWYCINWI